MKMLRNGALLICSFSFIIAQESNVTTGEEESSVKFLERLVDESIEEVPVVLDDLALRRKKKVQQVKGRRNEKFLFKKIFEIPYFCHKYGF